LGKILRPFDNMRMSRSNEVRTRWGESKERLWIGHSSNVMRKHYLVLSDEEFAEAAGAGKAVEPSHVIPHVISTVNSGR
jgi:hypothetical protein